MALKCDNDPQMPTCVCEPPCGAQCVECGNPAFVIVSYNEFFNAHDEGEEDCEVWVCRKCAGKLVKSE